MYLKFVKCLFPGAIFAALLMLQTFAQAAGQEAAVNIPDTPEGIWQAVDKETDEIAKMIQSGAIRGLHQHAFAVRDLVAALPAVSASLPADRLDKVKSDSKFVATLAARLDAAGDTNDKPAAESNFGKLKDVLKKIRDNYAGTSPEMMNSGKP